ncbi:Fc.00g030890.m01.CDS01 [Cosmosporella sp. VM-42]
MTIHADALASLADGIKKTAVIDMNSTKKPYLVFCAAPADGHTIPLVRIAGELIKRGFGVTFIAGSQFEEQIAAIGAEHVPIAPMLNPKMVVEREAIPPGIPRLLWDLKHVFVGRTPERWEVLKEVLERLRKEDSTREIVLVPESFFMGVNPLVLGAPLPKGFATRPKVVNLQVVPYMATSVDTGPIGPGLPPDSSESGRARNALINQMMVGGPFAEPIAQQTELLKQLGATEILEPQVPFHHWMLIHDITLQMCPPSLEYPRSDMPSHVKFAGCLTPKPISPDFVYPEWWDEVMKSGKKIVTVTQGTIANNYPDLLIPTIQALADRDDLFVIATLGHRNAMLPESVTIPSNARVIDYLPYDAILPHTSVFVMNAGYGGFLHGVTNGVPMVLGGETEDKPEIAMRGEWSGVAVNLRTGRPSLDEVRAGVEQVLADGSYKERVEEIRRENETMNVFDIVEREIMGVLE